MQGNRLSHDEVRQLAEDNLFAFAKLVHPGRLYGAIHEELFHWWTRPDAGKHQLVLLPRDHQKSFCIAVRAAWEITRNPDTSLLYISATSPLAMKQLHAIKSILTSPIYRRYWPDMVNADEGKREKWTATEISVDHPKRKYEGTVDSTVKAVGLTTNVTGFHCKIAVLDDIVVPGNAYTTEGRDKVATLYSQLASVETTGSSEWVVGTRYYATDIYQRMIEMKAVVPDPEIPGDYMHKNVYEVFEREVENVGDGTGEFLWPRQRRKDGRWFGFDEEELARKKAKYLDKAQFYAQYYNNPVDPENQRINHDKFQYYDQANLKQLAGRWYYKDRALTVVAAIDFAFSISKKADYTALVVLGMDSERNIYVLDIDRFRTDKISVMFEHVIRAYVKWDFRKMRAETNVGQRTVVNEFRECMKREGVFFKVEEFQPTARMGKKEERLAAILEPRYDSLVMYHYKGGNCQTLEEELLQARPAHDDVKDALASGIEILKPPPRKHDRGRQQRTSRPTHSSRFGGLGVIRRHGE